MGDRETAVVGRYLRSHDSRTIHLDPCQQAGNAVEWRYAEGMSLHQVAAAVHAAEWLRLCKSCWPAEAQR